MNWPFLPLIGALALLCSGCASVSSTAVFYQPTTPVIYPPKAKDAVIPIMNAAPKFPFYEIGRIAFQTQLGYPFIQKAMIYNAQRVGADAVIIKDYKNWSVPSWYSVPPTIGFIPVGYGWGGCGGGWYGGGVVPVAYPGYAGVTYQNFSGIDARMIVFKR